eukprot:Hpha_TRINITY_DN19393_c0_g1::TRINITY_DN19393_c0_g1_i1::g.81282::m.81282
MAAADVRALPTGTLVEELERLVKRVKDRDEKYYKRLRYPMGHAHPSQFWPLCAEAYKLTTWNRPIYYRPEDWLQPFAFAGWAVVMWEGLNRLKNPNGWMYSRRYKYWVPLAFAAWGIGMFSRSGAVELRMYGLEENDREIEKYGPLFPDEVELAARRKEKYEQEYIRVREGFFNFREITERVDRPVDYFYTRSAPGQSGYFDDQKARRNKELQHLANVNARNAA